jgi:hypothetical protein
MVVASTQGSARRTQISTKQSSGDTAELTAAQAAESAIGQLASLTTRELVGVTGVEPIDDGWRVEVEVLEESRIPSTTDLLALYEVDLNLSGELMAYRRTRQYVRGRCDTRNRRSG